MKALDQEVAERGVHVSYCHLRCPDPFVCAEGESQEWIDAVAGAFRFALDAGQVELHRQHGAPLFRIKAMTKAVLLDEDDNVVGAGYAFCSENFCRRTGREIALRRALFQPAMLGVA